MQRAIPPTLQTTRAPRPRRFATRVLWLCLILLASLLLACSGGTKETIQTEDLQIMKSSPHVKIPGGTAKDLDVAFQLLGKSDAELEQRVAAYRFIKTVNLLIWNNIRKDINDIEPGKGDFQEMLRVGRIHFKKAQWANALVWRELEKIHRRTAPSRQVRVPPEEHFARIWAKHDDPERAYNDMRGLLKALVETGDDDLYVDAGFVSDIRYSVAVFHALLGKSTGDLEALAKIVHGSEADAMQFALNLARLQLDLALRPDRSKETFRLIVEASPNSLQGFRAQLDLIETIWQERHFAKLRVSNPDTFDVSPDGLALLKNAAVELATLRELYDAKDKWSNLDQSKIVELQTNGEDIPRKMVTLMFEALVEANNDSILEDALSSSETFHTLFPSSGYAHQLYLTEAKILHEAGRYDGAYMKYESARQKFDKGSPEMEDILENLMFVATERKKSFELPQGPLDQQDLPTVLRDYTNAAGRYSDSILESDPAKAWEARYEVALIRYLYGSPQSAEATFEAIIDRFPEHPIAPKAAICLLDLQARKAIMSRQRHELDNAINLVLGIPQIRDIDAVKAKLSKVQKKRPAVGRTIF